MHNAPVSLCQITIIMTFVIRTFIQEAQGSLHGIVLPLYLHNNSVW